MIPCEIYDLKKSYDKNIALKGLTFNVKAGEIVGLIGQNGAGKTTTINAIIGLVKADGGHIALFGEDSEKLGHKLRKDVGYGSSESGYYPNLTVRENLIFVADCKGVSYDRINYLAGRLELPLSKKAKELSLGNKKKLSIVVALLASPRLIILDEPTDGLDPLIKQEFLKLIEEEKARGASIIISSHALTDIQRLCDRVVIISEGKLIAIEQMQQLKLKRLKSVLLETRYSIPEITLPGVSNIVQEGTIVKFNFNGDMKRLINFLSKLDLTNIEISDSDLEGIFLHFYE